MTVHSMCTIGLPPSFPSLISHNIAISQPYSHGCHAFFMTVTGNVQHTETMHMHTNVRKEKERWIPIRSENRKLGSLPIF